MVRETKMAAPMICVPGQRICRLDENHSTGYGTYERNGFIFSSLAGQLHAETKDGKKCIEVRTGVNTSIVPSVDSIVTARVTSVNPRFCKCSIIAVDRTSLSEPFRGILRQEDVRSTEKDKVELYKCFRPGDIVIGRVVNYEPLYNYLSLGDAYSYLISTAENELGVVVATSEAGAAMVPISWCEMQCPKTFTKEYRKVAKVQPQFIESDET